MAVSARRFRPVCRLGPLLAALVLASLSHAPGAGQEAPPRLLIATAAGEETATFAVTVEPGGEAAIDVRLGVIAGAPVATVAWVANVTSPINGGISLTPEGVPPEGPAQWVAFATGPLTLEPGTMEARPARVAAPDDARPGLYVAAIAVAAVEPVPVAGVEGVTQVVRAAALIAITVPGEVEPAFAPGEPTLVQRGEGGVIQVPVANTGTVPVHPRGTLRLEDAAGAAVVTIEVRMGAIQAAGGALLEAPLEPLPAAGEYRLTLELVDPDSGVSARIEDRVLLVPEAPGAAPGATPALDRAQGAPATPDASGPDQPARAEIRFEDATVRADGQPPLSVFVEAHIANPGTPIGSARLTLVVTHNGRVVAEAALADRIALPTGVTTFSTRYAPEDGFGPGIWTFALELEAVDEAGEATPLAGSGTIAKLDLS